MQYPQFRSRRVRQSPAVRRLVRETTLSRDDLVYPLFVSEGRGIRAEIASMPGQFRYSLDQLKPLVAQIKDCGISGILLFGIPERKDDTARRATAKDSVVAQAVRMLKDTLPSVVVFTDICVCAYTEHGHCGILSGGDVDNDATLELLGEMALSHAAAGADFVAPSDMMDGRVAFIRDALDESDHEHVGILSYAAKYASAYYGPFRDAARSAPAHGDRRGYQMDPANAREAFVEVALDIEEGADMIMVKPALAYLDIIYRIRDEYDLPLAAFNVSGEYSMIKAAAERGFIDEQQVMLETLTAIKRAGADVIVSYHALEAAKLL